MTKRFHQAWREMLADKRVLALLLLGFSGGLPLALTASTLAIRLVEAGVDKASIGLFAAVAMPYAFKFLWAPVVDSVRFPLLAKIFGRRRGWLFGAQTALMAAIVFLAFAEPALNPWLTALAAFCVAFCSATQDIVVDAYRVELLPQERQATAAAVYVLGYRLAMIMSSAGALYLATYMGWAVTYLLMAGLITIGMTAALLAGEPQHGAEPRVLTGNWFKEAVIAPLKEFSRRPQWALILAFTALYKLPDAFIGLMSGAFLLELGFTKTQIADIAKLFGLVATIAGGFLGGWLATRMRLLRLLWIIGLGQGISNLLYVLLEHSGPSLPILALVVSMDNLVSGMSGTVFVAYLSGLCSKRFTATQYALLSSLAGASRALLSTPAGWCAQKLGWGEFFVFSCLLSLPGLLLLVRLQRRMPREAAA